METRHTAGEWKYGYRMRDITANGKLIATVHCESDHPANEAAAAANARLITSAPNLLELVRSAYDRFTDNDMMPPNHALDVWLEQARAALAKAEGVRE